MELFIPGLILVALMVYASTRIKKTAAAAYNEEFIESDKFTLIKPDGFLSPVDPPDNILFGAYSKDFGDDESGDLHRALAELKFHSNKKIDERIAEINSEIDTQPNDTDIIINNKPTFSITGITFNNGIEINVNHLLIAYNNGVYDLRSCILNEFYDDYSSRINEMNASFKLK